MSRFFAAGSSDSESSEGEEEQPILTKPAPLAARSYFLSDDEEETKRVVRSQKDKRFQELSNSIKQLKNHKKIKDMAKVLTEFETLGKAFTKAKAVVDKEGIPPFFIRGLAELEDFVKLNWEDTEGRKKLSKINAKALATLRQKLRKYNKDFEGEITKYRENPTVSGESSAEEGSDAEEDDDNIGTGSNSFKKGQFEQAKKVDMKSDSEDDDDDDWPSSDDETSSSSSDDERGPMELHASMFLKKVRGPDDKSKEKKKAKQKTQKVKVQDEDGWTQVKTPREKAKQLFPKDTEITHAVVLKKLQEILAHRGKKGTDRVDQIDFLKELRQISEDAKLGPSMTVKLLFNIVSSIFDYNPNVATCMKASMWQECLKQLLELVEILTEHKEISIGENIPEESENVQNPDEPLRVRGCILAMIERMDEEFTKMLQGCDCHSTEYVERLSDEVLVCQLIEKLQSYLEDMGSRSEICRIYLRRIEHLYYKVELKEMRTIVQKKEAEDKKADADSPEKGAADSKEKENAEMKETDESSKKEEAQEHAPAKGPSDAENINQLCKFIYSKDTSDRIRTRAMLCHVYHHAIHDRFYEARDLMLMSHLQESIQHSDIPTQILYNRTMVQLGLCAFRHGMIRDAHNALNDVQSSGRAKELLAQGLMQQRQYERTPEQEKIEKRRQVPFHMHINLELLECVYLTSAMLLEIPYMAAHEFDYRRRIISKSFHYQLRQSDKQTLVGPPESMREHVVAASKAMKIGDWKKCRDYILAVKVWTLFSQPEQVRDMLTRKIQEESLRTYLFTYNHVYDSLSLHTLADMFELPASVVHSIISKMIINEELQASWDEPTQTVVMHRGAEPTLLQSLALQLAEKVSNLVENNERIYDSKHGGFMQFKDRQGGDRRQTGDRRQAPGDRRQGGGQDRRGGSNMRQGPPDRRQGGGRFQRQYQRDY